MPTGISKAQPTRQRTITAPIQRQNKSANITPRNNRSNIHSSIPGKPNKKLHLYNRGMQHVQTIKPQISFYPNLKLLSNLILNS